MGQARSPTRGEEKVPGVWPCHKEKDHAPRSARVCGTQSRLASPERRDHGPTVSRSGLQSSTRCGGASPRGHRRTGMATLNRMRRRTGSQCNSSRIGATWLQRQAPDAKRAAEFWSDLSRRIIATLRKFQDTSNQRYHPFEPTTLEKI